MVKFYNDGYWADCEACGADGLWMVDPDNSKVIFCECGHEVSLE